MAGLKLNGIKKRYGNVEVIRNVDLDIADGEFVVFVGPSGCGKSTLLRMIAGLEEISGGELYIDGKLCNEMEPRERGIAMVFQSYALYPHLTVRENMGFGLSLNKTPRDEMERRVNEAARILKLEPLLDRKPSQLSGGQRQRVAIGRAIIRKPTVFLFDEPLSNLDAALRMDMRMEIAKLHKDLGATMVYVTHDQIEAMTLADKIVVLEGGVVQQIGAPIDIYKNPANKFVAGFIGSPKMNFMDVTVDSVSAGRVTVASSAIEPVAIEAKGFAVGDKALLGIRPQYLRQEQAVGAAGAMKGSISLVERLGTETIVSFETPSNERALAVIPRDEAFEAGSGIEFSFDPKSAHLFPAA
ncbi:ABC transporter ATP-binding protein [Mesorhizobium sp. Root554]|uniref:ABC transporter ATP-binding protein n=1 Tax=unclassified Mesorhizobium TaxID=325217 RepID=UPI0006FE023E|nr:MULTISPECIES: sn-glycerol-3-phosphate ABC transporter ATP-binding protein UgpC [unclassified Mesorhizobium]KQZ13220.1 ABC transporter ATP-binding protein [Mesorhizobium sp. Root1471]KQZ35734.1 ABC transporter ATP-binding protein [Mesorhizobium sp. Root554]